MLRYAAAWLLFTEKAVRDARTPHSTTTVAFLEGNTIVCTVCRSHAYLFVYPFSHELIFLYSRPRETLHALTQARPALPTPTHEKTAGPMKATKQSELVCLCDPFCVSMYALHRRAVSLFVYSFILFFQRN